MIQKVDFLGIGAHKAATTWLFSNLQKHPAIWLPPRKELHYFDRSPIFPSPSHLASKHIINRLFGREKYNKRFRKRFNNELKSAIKSKDWEITRWTLRYFLGTYNDDWYLSLFNPGDGKLKGEITPSYSILNLKEVQHIRALFPELKIILILINPIERAWSHLRSIEPARQFNKIINNLNKMKEFIDSPPQSLRSDYVRCFLFGLHVFRKNNSLSAFMTKLFSSPID